VKFARKFSRKLPAAARFILCSAKKIPNRFCGFCAKQVWDDIRELTSGYFAGDEAIRNEKGERAHKQQSPISLLLRIILSSSKIGDKILDPFAGTGTTAVVAKQLSRNSVSFEIDRENAKRIENRLAELRPADSIEKFFDNYRFTENLAEIWGKSVSEKLQNANRNFLAV
jgi:tRNA G10  N-methylase Trm11